MSLIQSIKSNEGFRSKPYKDTLGFDTIGYGTKLPLTKKEYSLLVLSMLSDNLEHPKAHNHKFIYSFNIDLREGISKNEADLLLKYRLSKKIKDLAKRFHGFHGLNIEIKAMLIEMCYQMGVDGVLSFKRMIQGILNRDYKMAYLEGLNSLWAKQTPKRAKKVLNTLLQ